MLKQFSTKTLLHISLLPLLCERRFGTRIDGLHLWRYRTVRTTNVAKKGPVTTIGSLHLFLNMAPRISIVRGSVTYLGYVNTPGWSGDGVTFFNVLLKEWVSIPATGQSWRSKGCC